MKQKIAAGVFALMLVCTSAGAADLQNGTYVANTETLYINPDTGVTDDSGNNPEIGEGMCRSAVADSALIEQTDDGTYVTIRMLLSSNVKQVVFSVQQTVGDASSYQTVTPEITAENAALDSTDYRFAVPAADSYIRCSMYVTPMSRDVMFYLYVDAATAQAGASDFVATNTQKETEDTQVTTPAASADYSEHWAKDYIASVVGAGYVDLDSSGNYNPNTNVTRRVFVTGFAKMEGVSATGTSQSAFSDVAASDADAAYIAWASENGIVNGKSEGIFAPDASITREEMATMIYRYMNFKGYVAAGQAQAFADAGSISAWATDAVSAVQAAGIINGKGDNKFDPKNTATRAEYAVILVKFADVFGA